MAGKSELDEAAVKEMHEIFYTIDEHYFPNGNEWIANETISCADFAYASSIAALVVSRIAEKPPNYDNFFTGLFKN